MNGFGVGVCGHINLYRNTTEVKYWDNLTCEQCGNNFPMSVRPLYREVRRRWTTNAMSATAVQSVLTSPNVSPLSHPAPQQIVRKPDEPE